MIGIVRALRRHERVARVAIPSLAVKEADAAYLGEPPPPLSVVQITDTGAGRYVVDGPVGHVETLLHDDFLHVGEGPSHTRAVRKQFTGTRTTTSTSFSNFGAEPAIQVVDFVKHHDSSRMVFSVSLVAVAVTNIAQLELAAQMNGVDHVAFTGQLNAAIGTNGNSALEYPHGDVEVEGIPAGTYTVTLRWRRASGTGTISTFSVNQASMTVTETGGVMGDTPWELVDAPLGFGVIGAGSSVPGVGNGVARLRNSGGSGLFADDVMLRKSSETVVTSGDVAHWLSARVRLGTIPGEDDLSPTYMVGFNDSDFPLAPSATQAALMLAPLGTGDPNHWRVQAVGSAGGATEFATGNEPAVDEWVDLDLVIVGGGFAAGWVDGEGPYYVDDAPDVDTGMHPFLSVNRFPAAPAAHIDFDWVRVVAFNTGAGQEINPDGTTVVPPPAVHPRLLDAAAEFVDADTIAVVE